MLQFYNRIKNIGVTSTLSKTENKRVRLLNLFISNWFLIEMVLMAEDAINKDDPTLQLVIHSGTVLGLITTLFLQHKHYYTWARILFFSLMLYSNFMFCNFGERGGFIEYFYVVFPVIALLFTDNKYVYYSFFVASYLLFVIPINIYPIYPEGTFGSPVLILIQFVIAFFLVLYFKNANIKSEAELEHQRKKLEELNEFQSQFFVNVSHEIRTPLTLVKAATDKLDFFNNTTYSKESNEIKKGINHQVQKIKTIVDNVLDLAKMKNADFKINQQPTDINTLLNRIYVSFEPLCTQKQIELNLNTTKDAVFINADILFLEKAVNNFLSNAVKYTPKNGRISVNVTQKNNKVSIAIQDTGIGISKKDLSKIFDRFYQVNNDINKAGGSGIGLAFSSEIIDLHQGTLNVQSKLEKGTTFTITFPKIEAPTSIIQETTENNFVKEQNSTLIFKDITSPSNYTILIVDDNYEMRNYLKDILQNYRCEEAENGEEALKILQNKKIDFVVTDYMMPVMNGLNLIQNIRNLHIDIPILMLTARTDTQSKLDVLRLGIDDYLNKPFEKEELQIRIKNALFNFKNKQQFITSEAIKTNELSTHNEWIENIRKYVYENCGKHKITQEDIAQYLATSRSSLHRKIKSTTGLTPNELIVEIKLQKARYLAEQNPDILTKTLALEVGYAHTSHFTKLYKERFGVLPLAV